jgi:hypothetical protein
LSVHEDVSLSTLFDFAYPSHQLSPGELLRKFI